MGNRSTTTSSTPGTTRTAPAVLHRVAVRRIVLLPPVARAHDHQIYARLDAQRRREVDGPLPREQDVGRLSCDGSCDPEGVLDTGHRTGCAGRPVVGHDARVGPDDAVTASRSTACRAAGSSGADPAPPWTISSMHPRWGAT